MMYDGFLCSSTPYSCEKLFILRGFWLGALVVGGLFSSQNNFIRYQETARSICLIKTHFGFCIRYTTFMMYINYSGVLHPTYTILNFVRPSKWDLTLSLAYVLMCSECHVRWRRRRRDAYGYWSPRPAYAMRLLGKTVKSLNKRINNSNIGWNPSRS